MSFDFNTLPNLSNVLIYSGLDFPYEKRVNKNLTRDAKTKAIADLKTKYEAYAADIRTRTSKEFFKMVEASLEGLKRDTPKNRAAVINKINHLTYNEIVKEKKSWIPIFIQCLWNAIFNGIGFNTWGTYGGRLTKELQKVDTEVDFNKLNSLIHQGIDRLPISNPFGGNPPSAQNQLTEMKDRINNLPETTFLKILNKVIFKTNETAIFHNKLTFVKNLNDEKRALFNKTLLAREDWRIQSLNIVSEIGATYDDINSFIPLLNEESV